MLKFWRILLSFSVCIILEKTEECAASDSLIKAQNTSSSSSASCAHWEHSLTSCCDALIFTPFWQLVLCVAGSVEVSRRSPVASWLCAMLYCFGSYILADIMLGSCPVDYFQHNSHILLASAVWWENPQNQFAHHSRFYLTFKMTFMDGFIHLFYSQGGELYVPGIKK